MVGYDDSWPSPASWGKSRSASASRLQSASRRIATHTASRHREAFRPIRGVRVQGLASAAAAPSCCHRQDYLPLALRCPG
jgi:hypothetical protein